MIAAAKRRRPVDSIASAPTGGDISTAAVDKVAGVVGLNCIRRFAVRIWFAVLLEVALSRVTVASPGVSEQITAAAVKGVWEAVGQVAYVFVLNLRDPKAPFLAEFSTEDDKTSEVYVLGDIEIDKDHRFLARGASVRGGRSAAEHVEVRGTGIASKHDGRLKLTLSFFLAGSAVVRQVSADFVRIGYFRELVSASLQSQKAVARVKRSGRQIRELRQTLKENPPAPPKHAQ